MSKRLPITRPLLQDYYRLCKYGAALPRRANALTQDCPCLVLQNTAVAVDYESDHSCKSQCLAERKSVQRMHQPAFMLWPHLPPTSALQEILWPFRKRRHSCSAHEPASPAMQCGNEGHSVPVFHQSLQCAGELPVSVVDQHQDPRTAAVPHAPCQINGIASFKQPRCRRNRIQE